MKYNYYKLKYVMLHDIGVSKAYIHKKSLQNIDYRKATKMSRDILNNVCKDKLIDYAIAMRWKIAELQHEIEKANVNSIANKLKDILEGGE